MAAARRSGHLEAVVAAGEAATARAATGALEPGRRHGHGHGHGYGHGHLGPTRSETVTFKPLRRMFY